MAATAKTQKEKPHALGPKLTPRHTAASMARAAKIATNRGLLAPKQSPTRFIAKATECWIHIQSPDYARSNISAQQQSNSFYKNDSKTDCRDPIQKSEEFEKPLLVLEDTLETDEIEERSILKTDIDTFETHSNENIEGSSLDVEDKNSNFMQTFTRSRPNTPQKGLPSAPSSRPTTPSSQRLSSSRPSTPASRSKIPSGRPSTPSDKTRVVSVRPPHKEEDDLKSTYLMKQREFQRMKKDLDLKQKTVLELYSSLKSMAEEGAVGCGEGFHISDLNIYDVGDWSSEEVAQLCRDAAAASDIDGAVDLLNSSNVIDEVALADLDSKVSTVPARFADLCIQAYTDRQEVIDWVRELMPGISDEYVETVEARLEKYNTDGLQLCGALMDFKSGAAEVVSRITQISRQVCRERSQLLAVGDSLVREIERLRQDVDARGNANEIHAEADVAKELEESRRELEEEKAARAITKEKLATTESQLRQTRARVAKMDRQLREAEASIASLTGTVKTLEDQSRQREVQLEARARKLKESLKTGEFTSNQIAQQRDCLIAEVQSLKEQIEAMSSQHKSTVQDLTKDLKEHKSLLEEQRQLIIKENDARKSLDSKVAECEELIEQLRSKNTELENSRPNPELPTEREMDMWSELQATKDTLRITEEEVIACKREKVRFLETLTKISEQENKVGMQQKLAAELLSKEEIVSEMQSQIREITKNMKLNEQKVIQYEQYVRDLQAHTHNMGAKGEESPNGVSSLDLQQEIMNLRMGLLEAEHRNEELSEFLAQKEQQLEQQDKTSRAQARIIKVREELINMLKNKETEQSRELSALQQDLEHRMKIVDEVNKQIAAKAEEIQELFATLENKQQQIHRLEKIVLALEEQQRRAQAQRTRHEEKIAALEHELAAGSRRERKFLFF